MRERRTELVDAIIARIGDRRSTLAPAADEEYGRGLRAAVPAAIDYGLTALEHGREGTGPIPTEAIAQAWQAARARVNLDTVLRRYLLGSALLGDFLIQEANRARIPDSGDTLRAMLGDQAAALDRLMTAVIAEYTRERERATCSPEQRLGERVRRLLAGEPCDSCELGYELEAWHLGAIASGREPGRALRQAASATGARLLLVGNGEDSSWGWLGSQDAIAAADVLQALAGWIDTRDVTVALGEPAHGPEGWRITHVQAQEARYVALRSPRPLTRYADVALVASVLRDEALARPLIEIYLAPLGARQHGGAALRDALRAYFEAERNASSAASALGVARHTMERRLRSIEHKLGQSLQTRQAELEVALRLEELVTQRTG